MNKPMITRKAKRGISILLSLLLLPVLLNDLSASAETAVSARQFTMPLGTAFAEWEPPLDVEGVTIPADTVETDQQQNPTGPEGLEVPVLPEATVHFTIVGQSEYDNALYLTQGIPVTDADLLAGVIANDENGRPVKVIVKDVGGLDRNDPQPGGALHTSEPYIIIYEAAHPVTGVSFAMPRQVYVTESDMTSKDVTKSDMTEPFALGVALTWNGSGPPVVKDGDTVTISGSISGKLDIPAGASIMFDIEGSAISTKGITLDIGAGATVFWAAAFTGASDSYLVSVTGSGSLAVTTGGVISNAGNGGAIGVTGAGTDITVSNGGIVYSNNGGNPILINADDVEVMVGPGGTVESMSGNKSAAIQVYNNLQGTKIIVNGGAVISSWEGCAINDGADADLASNNTVITVNDGTVKAEAACAIYSAGADSTVTVDGGTVSNTAAGLSDSTIYMNGGAGTHVIVNGGTITNTGISKTGYTIQTTGNVKIDGGTVSVLNGRAINLVGPNSTATVNGGMVRAVGAGTAISTATTTDLPNASVEVEGGTVSATAGKAIQVTGTDSKVTVSGGQVSATTGDAIYAVNSAANAVITVSGGQVSASVGRAIYAGSSGSTVKVTDGGSGGTGGQVWVVPGNTAVQTAGKVTVDGGLALACGENASSVISVTAAGSITWPAGKGVVAAWDREKGPTVYVEGRDTALIPSSNESPFTYYLKWKADPVPGGIYYTNGATQGFLPLSNVTVTNEHSYGLIFDADTGKMYPDIDGSHLLTPGSWNLETEFTSGQGTAWEGVPGQLTLKGFSWDTSATVALTIVGTSAANATIRLEEGSVNSFTSAGNRSDHESDGILVGIPCVIEGGGTLNATAKKATEAAGSSYGLAVTGGGSLRILSGTVEAVGGKSAFKEAPDAFPAAYTWWAGTAAVLSDLRGPGTAYFSGTPAFGVPYGFSGSDRYVKISVGPIAVIGDVTVSGVVGTALTGTQKTKITIYGDTLQSVPLDISHWFSGLPDGVVVKVFSISLDTMEFAFTKSPWVPSDAAFHITIPEENLTNGGALAVQLNPSARFNIVEAYDLIVSAEKGGQVSGTASGWYASGVPVSVTAAAEPGYHFTGWMADGTSLGDDKAAPVKFLMPDQRVTLTAAFTSDPKPESALTIQAGTGGSIILGTDGNYEEDAVIYISARADSGYQFSGWKTSAGGSFDNKDSTGTTFTMPGNPTTVTADFTDTGGIPASPDASVSPGSAQFDKNLNPADPTDADHKDITITLDPAGYTLSFLQCGGGIPQPGTDYYVSGDTCTIKKEYLTTLDVGAQPVTFHMNGGANPVLNVIIIDTSPLSPQTEYPLVIQAETGGSITLGTGGNYKKGDVIPIRADAAVGYTFNGWTTLDGGSFGNAASADTTFTMPGNATMVTANITYNGTPLADARIVSPNPEIAVRFDKNHASADYKDIAVQLDWGSYTLPAGGIKCGTVPLVEGRDYTEWTDPFSSFNYHNYTLKKEYLETRFDGTVVIVFDMDNGSGFDPFLTFNISNTLTPTYTLTVQAGVGGTAQIGTGGGTSGSYAQGVSIDIKAQANNGYTFSGWTASPTPPSNSFNNPALIEATFTMPGVNTTVTANFLENATINPTAAIFDKNTAADNKDIVVTLTTKGHSFLRLLNGTTEIFNVNNTNTNFSYTANSNGTCTITIKKSYLATLNIGTYSITFDVDSGTDPVLTVTVPRRYALTIRAGVGGRIIEGTNGNYEKDEEIPIEASANSGYTFSGWTTSSGGSFDDKNSADTWFTMPGSATTVTANFTAPTTDASLNPASATFDKNSAATEHRDIAVTLSTGGNTLSDIRNGSYILQSTDYTVSGNVYTIKKEYLVTLNVGAQIITFNMNAGADPVLNVTVTDTSQTNQTNRYPVITALGTWTGRGPATFSVGGSFDKFVRLRINNNVLDPANYHINAEGEAVSITLEESYLATLADGTYTIRAEFTDGYTDLPLTVLTVPQTGDSSNMIGWIIVLLLAALGMLGLLIWRKRRQLGGTW